jgi:hypothetical protein
VQHAHVPAKVTELRTHFLLVGLQRSDGPVR